MPATPFSENKYLHFLTLPPYNNFFPGGPVLICCQLYMVGFPKTPHTQRVCPCGLKAPETLSTFSSHANSVAVLRALLKISFSYNIR